MIRNTDQLKDKIRNTAKNTAADAQLLLRIYMMERFLERVSLSKYKDNIILKGGMLVASMVGLHARSTMDIDVTIHGSTVNIEAVRTMIDEIIAVPIEDQVQFQIKQIQEIMDEAEYPGIRVSMNAFFDSIRIPLKIDISTGDAITPRAIEYPFRLMLEERTISILSYNIETVLAEKLETIITRTTANTRMRDFYDIYLLQKLYSSRIDADHLQQALHSTAIYRGTLPLLSNGPVILQEIEHSPRMKQLWIAYQKKFPYAAAIEWQHIMDAVQNLYAMASADRI